MATLPNSDRLWSVEEYLRTSWSPDREFVDGRIEERNLGEKEHSIIQRYLIVLFGTKYAEWGIEVYPELRTQTKIRNFRVPDLLVVWAEDKFDRYLTKPPLIAVEIFSPEDTFRDQQEKADEYRNFGVEHIWVIDPDSRKAYIQADGRLQEAQNGELAVAGTPIRVDLSEMFAQLDR